MTLKQLYTAALFSLLLPAATLAQPVKAFESQSLERIVASQRGKPFLLLVWSMDCEFCQASLDNLAKARRANPGLTIITVSTDPVSDRALGAQISNRLGALMLAEHRWGYGSEPAERLRYAIDPRWHGEKPRSYWYDASGNRTAYSGLIKLERLDEWQRVQLGNP